MRPEGTRAFVGLAAPLLGGRNEEDDDDDPEPECVAIEAEAASARGRGAGAEKPALGRDKALEIRASVALRHPPRTAQVPGEEAVAALRPGWPATPVLA